MPKRFNGDRCCIFKNLTSLLFKTICTMFRYLLNLSYIGTPFRGVQRQVGVKNGRIDDPTTVQGQIEIGLKRLEPINQPATILSSRTDAGVHAIHTTMHVDLERTSGIPYEPAALTTVLNRYFNKHYIPIRILKTYIVPNDFHCRYNAISRTYLYRLGIISSDNVNQSMLLQHLPIQEFDRSLFISTSTFDIDKAKEAAELFVGYHDFRTFKHKEMLRPDKNTRRNIEKLEIREARPFCSDSYGWPSCLEFDKLDYRMCDIILKGNGFLHKQVRRTVASLIAVAKGIVTPRDIKFMLEIPSHRSWDPRIKTAPAQGLYLCEVAYSKDDLEQFKEQ